MKYKVHLDTVLAYRTKYLQDYEREEKDPKFISLAQQVKLIYFVFSYLILSALFYSAVFFILG
jgi:hypothetical protein